MSWKVGVKTAGDKDWVYNGLSFGTKQEAEDYAEDLFMRWTAVNETNVTESAEPVNYSFIGFELKSVQPPATAEGAIADERI